MKITLKIFLLIVTLLGLFITQTGTASMPKDSIIAINIALVPEANMTNYAKNINQELRKIYPQGFELNDSHHPHITLLQQYVKKDDLENIYRDLSGILTTTTTEKWIFNSDKFSIHPINNTMGALLLDVVPTSKLAALQNKIIMAMQPYLLSSATADAFDSSENEPQINQFTFDYVRNFVSNSAGKNYHPHITLGLAPIEILNNFRNQKPLVSSFSPARISIFQLGNNGTARRQLTTWKF